MNTVQLLTEARNLIQDRAHWTQGVCARDAEGIEVIATDPVAVCWCAEGALLKIALDLSDVSTGCHALDRAAQILFGKCSFVDINDSSALGHDAVLELFNYAIQNPQGE